MDAWACSSCRHNACSEGEYALDLQGETTLMTLTHPGPLLHMSMEDSCTSYSYSVTGPQALFVSVLQDFLAVWLATVYCCR